MKPQSPNCSAWLHDTWCPWQNNENEVFLGKNKGQNKCDPTQSRVFEVKRARHTDVETWPRGNRQRRGNREFSVRCDVHQPKTWRLGVRATLGSRSSGLLASAAKTNPVFRRILTSCFHMAERTRQDEEHARAFGDYCAGLIFSNTGFDVIASIRRFIQQLLNTIKGSLVVFSPTSNVSAISWRTICSSWHVTQIRSHNSSLCFIYFFLSPVYCLDVEEPDTCFKVQCVMFTCLVSVCWQTLFCIITSVFVLQSNLL